MTVTKHSILLLLGLVAMLVVLSCTCKLPQPGASVTPAITPEALPTTTYTFEPLATPPLEAGDGLRVVAAEVSQEPTEAGFEQYSVRLVFENHGTHFMTFPGDEIWQGGTVTTDDGYSYPAQIDTNSECPWPRQLETVIPPGFRLRGLVLYDYAAESPCRSELWAEFTVGATLEPVTMNLGTHAVGLTSPPQALQYPLVAGPQHYESLPTTSVIEAMEVRIGPAEAGPESTIIDLEYRNTDAGYSHEVIDPVVEIIDDEGWVTTPSLATGGVGWYAGEPVCPYTVGSAQDLGPLQTAMYQSCLLELAQQGEVYYLVVALGSDQLAVYEGSYQPSQRLVQAAFDRGMAAYNADDWIGAAGHFYEVLLIQPDHREATARIAQIRQALGTITFVDGGVLYGISPIDGDPVRLFSLDGAPQALEWSLDGHSVAYISNGRLVVVARDGSSPRTIVEGDAYDFDDLAWSPDQDSIAFTQYHKGLWIVGIQGGVARPLACATDYTPVRTVSWSPDGTTIVFTGDASNAIATDPQGASCSALPTDGKYDFIWSPSGRQVLATDSRGFLYLAAPDGSGMRGLWADTLYPADGHADAVWSPDGKYIAFEAFGGIYVVPVTLMREEGLQWTDTYNIVEDRHPNSLGWVSWILE